MAPPKKPGWSWKYPRCRGCGAPSEPGTENRRHHAKGYCDFCYVRPFVDRWREKQRGLREENERLKKQVARLKKKSSS